MLYKITLILLLGFISGISPDDDNVIVKEVEVKGSELKYTFSVTLESPDTGCNQYADWWEVISADGKKLIYRRILAHSHVNEQPFTRNGGAVEIKQMQEVIVRAHMNNKGYGSKAMIGTVNKGFRPIVLDSGFGKSLEVAEPQPAGCAF
ncbi:MAG: hypothetical protein ABFS32_11180 [Bacteroidota bacterium]